MKDKENPICGVSVERQTEGYKIESEIYQVCKHIAVDLVKIWELWDLEKGGFGYYFDISVEDGCIITFMQRGSMGDGPCRADWLFKHKTKWIRDFVSLTRDDIADPETFLSKHGEYRQEYDENLRKLKTEKEREEKEKRREEFENLKKEFGGKK